VNLSDADLTAYSGEHLFYELQYLWFSASKLARMTKPSPMSSVLIESFVIHLRNLIDFFYIPAGKERPDDVIAADFCPGWSESMSSTLETARERANKELSHLTLGRKSGSDPTKTWDFVGLFREVSNVAKRFAAQAPPTKLSPEIAKWLDTFHGNPSTASEAVALMTTNTTASMVTTSSK
jgi:hypothetical protein